MEEKGKRRTIVVVIVVTVAVIGVIVCARFAIRALNDSSRALAHVADPKRAPAQGAIVFEPTHSPDVGKVEDLPASAVKQDDNLPLLPAGSMAPDFTLASASGQMVRLSGLRGKAVLVEFFATWCPHCQAEAPHLKQLMATLPETKFALLQVVADSENAASLVAFDNYYGISTPALLDPGPTAGTFYQRGSMGPVTRQYKVGIFPTFYVIDPKGRIAWRADHEQPDALLLQQLQNAAGS